MKDRTPNEIAALEKAIGDKYGEETVANPRATWDEEKEKRYLEEMKEMYNKVRRNEEYQEKVDVNGIKVTKKLLNRESLKCCPVCGNFPRTSMDDVCLLKFDCCSACYDKYIFGREERWKKGWRPNEAQQGNS